MKEAKNGLAEISENEIMYMFDDTSNLIVNYNANMLSDAAIVANQSNILANEVEFWKWMGRNYNNSGIFNSAKTMQNYISEGAGKADWMVKQVQGKGYEWDWMTSKRGNVQSFFKTYDAGDVANRAASDVTEKSILTGKTTEYQMKAYASKTNPKLKNTPKDMNVVTNAEKTGVVKENGYNNVEKFQDSQIIKNKTNERMENVKNGKVQTSYNFKNIAGTMGKAGLIGCVAGMGIEAVQSYKLWKSGIITDSKYLEEILKAGGDTGITAGLSAGIMIPVTAAITAMGVTSLLTIPVAFVINSAVNKFVALCFGRGKYKEILSEARYYQNIENVYDGLIESMQRAGEQYYDFVYGIAQQNEIHNEMKTHSMAMNKELYNLYNTI